MDLDIQEFANFYVSIGLQKNSELVEMFDYQIIKMQENGIIARFKHKWMYNTDKNYYGMAEAVTLEFENLIFPFMCLVVGIVAAATVLLAEWILFFFQRGNEPGILLLHSASGIPVTEKPIRPKGPTGPGLPAILGDK